MRVRRARPGPKLTHPRLSPNRRRRPKPRPPCSCFILPPSSCPSLLPRGRAYCALPVRLVFSSDSDKAWSSRPTRISRLVFSSDSDLSSAGAELSYDALGSDCAWAQPSLGRLGADTRIWSRSIGHVALSIWTRYCAVYAIWVSEPAEAAAASAVTSLSGSGGFCLLVATVAQLLHNSIAASSIMGVGFCSHGLNISNWEREREMQN